MEEVDLPWESESELRRLKNFMGHAQLSADSGMEGFRWRGRSIWKTLKDPPWHGQLRLWRINGVYSPTICHSSQ